MLKRVGTVRLVGVSSRIAWCFVFSCVWRIGRTRCIFLDFFVVRRAVNILWIDSRFRILLGYGLVRDVAPSIIFSTTYVHVSLRISHNPHADLGVPCIVGI